MRGRVGFFGKTFFYPKSLRNDPKIVQKWGVFKENLVINFYWICSLVKIYIICCVPAQIPSLRKIFFPRCRPKCYQKCKQMLSGHGQKWKWPVWSWDSLHVGTLLCWPWPFSSRDPKTCYILWMNIWIELIFGMLIVMQQFLVRLISYSLTFKC